MASFTYNDITFTLEARAGRWDLSFTQANGVKGLAGVGLFEGLSEADATTRAQGLARTLFPVGVRSVGPDVGHPTTIGDLKLVPPDVAHPTFIYWPKDSASDPKHS